MGLFDVKNSLAMLGEALTKANDDLVAAASNPSITDEDLAKLQSDRASLQNRFDITKSEHDRMETEAKATIQIKERTDDVVANKAAFYRAQLLGQRVPDAVLNSLQAIPAGDGTGGENFIPSTLMAPILTEPADLNPLRGVWTSTAIKGLELPRLAVTVNGADAFIDDDESAGEVTLGGDKITWGRFKSKLVAKVSDSVVHGADASLVSTIEQSLRDALAYKELKCAFAAEGAHETNGEHMTFYEEDSSGTVIAEVEGTTQLSAIRRAIYSLHPAFRTRAKVAMAGLDWADMLEDLINENATYVNALAEQVLSKPMLEIDLATTPVVGDFSQAHINYDPDVVYDTDKDVISGEYLWVVTVWFDIWRLRDSAFRLAVVEASA